MSEIEAAAQIFKTLGDEGRLATVLALREKELSVNELAEKMGAGVSLLSQRLKLLYQSGLVKKRREKQQIFYSLKDEHITQIVLNAIDHATGCLEHPS